MRTGRAAVVVAALVAATVAVAPAEPQPAPAPGEILFERNTADVEDVECAAIWSVDPDGKGLRPFIDRGQGDCDPDWSPDGNRVAFVSDRGGELSVYVADASGENAVAVTHPPNGAADFMPDWSPDGRQLAFERRPRSRNRYDLYMVDADGSNLRLLTGGHGFDGTPSWSPDGRIVFVSDRRHPHACPACSALWVLQPTDGTLRRITRSRFNALMPAWAPDGERIAWARAASVDSTLALYVMRSDTTDVARLDTRGEAPQWSPDSRTIVYSSGGNLYRIGADGSDRRRLTSGEAVDTQPTWRPIAGS